LKLACKIKDKYLLNTCVAINIDNLAYQRNGDFFAVLFICFLQKAGILLDIDGRKRIDDNALVALTLMIAASKPSEKEIMIKVILNLLNETR
jgi:hypothetical protein